MKKTIVLRIDVPSDLAEIFRQRGQEQARWMNQVIKILYHDKRHLGWRNFGPEGEHPIVKRNRDGSYKGDAWAMYPVFIKQGSPDRIPSILNTKSLQCLTEKIVLAWTNFLKPSIGNRPRSQTGTTALPGFHLFIRFFHTEVDIQFTEHKCIIGLRGIKMRETIILNAVISQRKSFIDYISPLVEYIKKHKVGIEFHEKKGKWYAHICVDVDVPEPQKNPNKIMGIDRGVVNLMTCAVDNKDNGEPSKTLNISASLLTHKMKRIESRISGLSQLKDKGHASAKKALICLKGKQQDLQKTYSRMVAADAVKFAMTSGANGIAVEDLSQMKGGRFSRATNRRIGKWPRTRVLDALSMQCAKHGLAMKEVYASGTSITCPLCKEKSKKNRPNRDTFKCISCGYANDADIVGATNIAHRGWRYWNSPKWKTSQSIPVADTTGNDSISLSDVPEARTPDLKATDGRESVHRNVVLTERMKNPTNGIVIQKNDENLSGEFDGSQHNRLRGTSRLCADGN